MDRITLRIRPLSPFGTPLLGDTLFGQLCWAVRHQLGEDRLRELLESYTEKKPFAVVSDAFPTGYLLRPALPLTRFEQPSDADRKRLKKRVWIPHSILEQPLKSWLLATCSDQDLTGSSDIDVQKSRPQPHNNINRLTGTTGEGFAPYAMRQIWFAPGLTLDLHIVFDPTRIEEKELQALFESIGATGYGRDASIGLGRFAVDEKRASAFHDQKDTDAYLTLAPCAPQGCGFLSHASYYQPFSRFGRHGDIAAVQTGKPFKTPILMAAAGAVLKPAEYKKVDFVGQGLGGNGTLSRAISETVHQGYAPVIGVRLPDGEGRS